MAEAVWRDRPPAQAERVGRARGFRGLVSVSYRRSLVHRRRHRVAWRRISRPQPQADPGMCSLNAHVSRLVCRGSVCWVCWVSVLALCVRADKDWCECALFWFWTQGLSLSVSVSVCGCVCLSLCRDALTLRAGQAKRVMAGAMWLSVLLLLLCMSLSFADKDTSAPHTFTPTP
eukprot:2017991-Rhodomonas_salina.4